MDDDVWMKLGPFHVVEERPRLDIRQAFRLVEIAYETKDMLVRNAVWRCFGCP